MVLESNTLEFLFLKDGEKGEPGGKGDDGKTLYTWIKYSQNAYGSNMTDDSADAIYIGLAYNKESSIESDNPSDYNWSKIKGNDGEQGDDGYTIILSNENISFSTDNNRKPLSNQTFTCEVNVFQGITAISDFTIGNLIDINGLSFSVSNHVITLSTTTSDIFDSDSGSISVPIIINGVSFTKTITFSLSKQGEQGSNGISVSSVSVQYYQSASATELIGGSWSIDRPTWVDGKYIWSKQITTLSNGSTSETDPVCITGGTGNTGATGRSVEDIITEYYLSTSKTEQVGGSWSETQQDWSNGHYVWTRSKIIYSNPSSTEYTTPVCDTTWESIQSQINTITETMSGVEQKVDANTKSITNKVWQTDITNSINNYDNTTTKELRDRVTQTETDITGIRNTVSDVQTTLIKKADGSIVTELQKTVSENKQDAESFKQTVSNTYATKDSLNNYSTTEQVQSIVEQKADSILGKVTDSEGNETTYQGTLAGLASQVKDAEGNITKITQTAKNITQEISDAKGSSTTLQARLEGIDSSVVDAETNAKSFATQEAERIQSVVQNNIDNVESNITQRADDIELNVSKKKDNPLTAIRYVRDWLNGSSEQGTNRWVACKVISSNLDIVNGLTATLLSSDGTVVGVQPSNIDVYTNGDISSETYIDSGSNNLQCLQLDLGEIRNDIDYIQVFHYYEDSRIYNHKFEVSSDGENWISLYNSVIQGGYSESASGMIYNISDTVYHDQYASLSVKLNEIESTVYDGMENINQSISTAEGNIKNIYGQLENVESNINTTINNLPDKNYVQTKIEEKAGQISTEIKTVENGLETKISKVVQDSDKWLINFAKLGMENSPGISTIIKLSEEGIRVSQSDGSEVLIDGNGLQGFYNNLAVFQLKKDLTITERTQISNGADFTTLKYINREYQTSNGTTKCLVHVVSGGSS